MDTSARALVAVLLSSVADDDDVAVIAAELLLLLPVPLLTFLPLGGGVLLQGEATAAAVACGDEKLSFPRVGTLAAIMATSFWAADKASTAAAYPVAMAAAALSTLREAERRRGFDECRRKAESPRPMDTRSRSSSTGTDEDVDDDKEADE